MRLLTFPLVATALAFGCSTAPDADVDPGFARRADLALEFARAHGAELAELADGRHDRDDIEAGRIEAPEPSPLVHDMLQFIDAAETYSEAILLARLAGQRVGEAPPLVPATLSLDPRDPDYEFAGHNVTLPYTVQVALDARRAARDAEVDGLEEAAFDAMAARADAKLRQQRRYVAHRLGWKIDDRKDLYVVDGGDDTIWRRKMPAGYTPSLVDGEPGSAPIAAGEIPEDAIPDGFQPGAGFNYEIIGSDGRSLRSRHNGYSMGGAAWEPKGAIVDDGRTTQEVPVEVDCTGVKIRERLVVTAGHCMFSDGSWNDNTKWIPGADGVDGGMNGRDPSPNGYKTRYTRIVRGNWFDHEWSNYDFGVFVLYDNSSSCSLHWHGWRKRSGLLNDYFYLYGYPGERRDCSASPLANDDCNGSIYGMGGTFTYAGSYRVRYAIDTQPGQSGTGFYEITSGDRYVLGVHRGKWSSSRNDGVRINDGNRDLINDAKADHPANACN